jgi:hypothetical protein
MGAKNLYIVCVLTLLVLPACAWLRGDPSEASSLTAKNLTAGGLGIGGVVVLGANAEAPDDLADLMRTAIIETRQDIKIVSSRYIERILGDESYAAVMRNYQANGNIRPELLATVAPELQTRFRFLVFGGIDVDTVSTRFEPKDQLSDETAPSTDYITKRLIGTTFHVYDLKKFALVWTVFLTASAERTISRRDQARTPGTLPTSPYPDPVSLQEVAVSLFEDFARQLPRPHPKLE